MIPNNKNNVISNTFLQHFTWKLKFQYSTRYLPVSKIVNNTSKIMGNNCVNNNT